MDPRQGDERSGAEMANTRSETRRKTGLVGVRVDPDLDAWLTNEAAARGLGKAEFVRSILDASRGGKRQSRSQRIFALSAEDRALIEMFNRHAGRLTGALVMTAKEARTSSLVPYHSAVERLLEETRSLRRTIDRILERLAS